MTSPQVEHPTHMTAATMVDLLWRHKLLFVAFPLALSIFGFLVAMVLPKSYLATVKLMPPLQNQSNALAILGQIGAFASNTATQGLGLRNPSDIYVSMLKSRTIADALVNRFSLKEVYAEDYQSETRRQLARNSTITASRDGVITIEVEDRDANRASDLANAYVEEFRSTSSSLAIGEASQRRVFFEGQLQSAKNDLTNAELELRKFAERAGLVNPQGQVGVTIAAAASLRGQIAAKEIQLGAMRSFATERNPEFERTMLELAGFRSELAKLERQTTLGKADVMVPFGKAPEVSLEYTRKFRDLKYHEDF